VSIDTTGLSPEEIAALQDDGDDGANDEKDDDAAAAAAGADDGLDDEGEAGEAGEGGDDLGADDGAAAAAEGEAADATAATSAEVEDDGMQSEFVPQSNARPVENYKERIDKFAADKAELRSKLSDGDIDIEQYETAKDAITAQETELKLEQRDYENAVKRDQDTQRQKWEWEQEQFFEAEENKSYKDKGLLGTALNAALNSKVIELAKDPANSKRSGSWFLQEADRQVRDAMGLTKVPAKQEKQEKQEKSRKPDLSGIPKTLGNLPAAEQMETGTTEFSYLDKLEGIALEQALATISRDPAKEQRYLRQA
jgi:hypothetical protein